ncbi:probable N-acetyltransferase 14 [Leucoraja erinacea]|uniref:probable N-acetyltransferase 14 n=1 Tax=Leucoraja erinaceus TaxID=7782 RepID=UPI00245805F0|nr:probable N-acetyltransferase 14 [Leucoraja erinacea]
MRASQRDRLSCREMRESETEVVMEILREGWGALDTRLLLYALTRPPCLLAMAVAGCGLRFVLGSCLTALLSPLLLCAGLLWLGLSARRRGQYGPFPGIGAYPRPEAYSKSEEAYTSAEASPESEACSEPEAYSDSEPYSKSQANPKPAAHSSPEPDSESEAYKSSEASSNPEAYSNPQQDSNPEAYSKSDTYKSSDDDSKTEAYARPEAYSKPVASPKPDAYYKSEAYSRSKGRSKPEASSPHPRATTEAGPVILVAIRGHDEEVCGCLGITAGHGGTAELSCLAVAPWRRRDGVASFLLAQAEARAHRLGYARVIARPELVNKAALALFRARGYRPALGGQGGGGGFICCQLTLEFVKEL